MKYLLVFLLLASCGEPLAGGDYQGEVLLTLHGFMVDQTECLLTAGDDIAECRAKYGEGEILMSVLWSNRSPDGTSTAVASSVVQGFVARAQLPAQFALDIHTPPDAGVLIDDGQGGRYAWGLVAVYTDRDGDQRFTAGVDWILGGGGTVAVVYTPSGAVIAGQKESSVWPPGYSLATIEQEDDTEPDGVCADGVLELEAAEDGHGIPAVTVTINAADPSRALPDTDCDGTLSEWHGLCPSNPDCAGRDAFCCPGFRPASASVPVPAGSSEED